MHCCEKKKVFLTGGTGLIGSQVLKALKALDFEVYALTIDEINPECDVHWIKGNLFNEGRLAEILNEIRPAYLLNFAWCASGDYLTSDLNLRFRDAGLMLLRLFKSCGGKRAVYVGTCFEYEFKEEPLKEDDPLNPTSLYAACKAELNQLATTYAKENGLSFGWGRIFYVYGKNEHPARLTASIINSLRDEKPVTIRTSQLKKDYMYTKDIAGAFAAFLNSTVEGNVNICTGNAISIKDFATAIAKQFNREGLLDLRNETSAQPPIIVGDNTRLITEIRYQMQYDLLSAVKDILNEF